MTAFPTASRSASSTSCSSPGTHFDFVIIRINRSTQGEIASILLGMHQQMFNLREGDSFPATRRRELALRLRSSRMATLCPKSLVLGCGAMRPRGWGFLYQRFSSLLGDEACQFRNQQSRTVAKFGDHSSIWDSWPIAFSGYPRGPRVACETVCPRHAASNLPAETRSRTRVSREPDGHRQRNPQRWSGLDHRHSSCLWFQMLGVEARSSLPHDQHDGSNLSGQG